MQQYVEFATNHWVLVLALLVISGLLLYSLVAGGVKGQIDPVAATGLINHEDALVLDVRPLADFSQGHIIHSVNVPMNGFKNQLQQLQKHKGRPVIVGCRSGAQSVQACKLLRREGFGEVYNLKGGILAWQNANLPLTKKG